MSQFRTPNPKFLDDGVAVQLFAVAMTDKMVEKAQQGYGGWLTECEIEHLWRLLKEHVKKGDPVDIANFAMMIWHRQKSD